ncbi:hypothetical protein GCM10011494_27920 [Novosphingobium endophyticum]|uniref:Glucosamine inositolphosphorylceramide transferase 1 N-terminal domain-containing protein n=2 Tax=Novosphingobium endophyticum TaxID=1955250 RepID=A0A916TU73_9SPHN|nr:hypothetical protein GCM10011494_27920 [Novosphingobium endophyticum]
MVLHSPVHPPDWCARLAEQIRAEPHLELVALLQPPAHLRRRAGSQLLTLWNALERKLAARPKPADFAAYSDATKDLPVLPVGDTAAIDQLGLDVILDLSGAFGSDCHAGLAGHGCWFLDCVDQEPGYAGLAAIASDAPVTTISLFGRVADRDACAGIATASLNTKFIAARNELFMCEKAVPLIMRALRRTRHFGSPDRLDDLEFARPRPPKVPEFLNYLVHLGRTGSRRALNMVRERIGTRPGMFFLKSDECAWSDFKPAEAPAHVSDRNAYFADPFLWQKDGSLFCFFEEYDYRTARGHISVGKFRQGELTEIQPALRTDYHLSFPFLFPHAGELYMMPETSEQRRIEVWRCRDFPNRWERYTTALDGVVASDSTLNLIDGTWWLFTNISNDPFLDMNTELHIFRADGPGLTRLEPHAVNPVVMNAREARNAGRILEIDGKLYRPAQDNSHGFYGYGLRLMEIRHLSLDDYEETLARVIAPDFEPGIIGCHHLDIRAGRVIMDVRKAAGGIAGRTAAAKSVSPANEALLRSRGPTSVSHPWPVPVGNRSK